MKPEHKSLYVSPQVEMLDEKREKARATDRITYDCFKAKVLDERVFCRLGSHLHNMSNDGSIALVSVLKGWKATVCQKCTEYDDVDPGAIN